MVPPPARRHDPVRREPAEEVPGHLPVRLRVATTGAALWDGLRDVVLFWVEQGVHVFRVDNPHTKPFPFWEWLIARGQARAPRRDLPGRGVHPAEVMHRLAKLGFTQSYTYFTWRNTKHELTEYFTELTQTDVREYFRPNFWPNTPDILHRVPAVRRPAGVQRRGWCWPRRSARATASTARPSSWSSTRPCEPGSEEYLDSEKYQLRSWDLDRPDSLARAHRPASTPSAARTRRCSDRPDLRFHADRQRQLISYGKRTPTGANVVLVVVNLDPHHAQSGWVELPLARARPRGRASAYQVHDLLERRALPVAAARELRRARPSGRARPTCSACARPRSEHDFEFAG